MMPRMHIGGFTIIKSTSRGGGMISLREFWEAQRRFRRSCEFRVPRRATFQWRLTTRSSRIWDKEHFNVYHERPSQENRERLISLAVGERESQILLHPHLVAQLTFTPPNPQSTRYTNASVSFRLPAQRPTPSVSTNPPKPQLPPPNTSTTAITTQTKASTLGTAGTGQLR